ncbi:hypothetical protein QOZ80_8AG0614670 [Eleusine coracana subsp. coracana]|nr:hypothetical protein QOZ80_8AG0614670 [Eleusine coracana subsp. coracana]
MSNKRRGEEKYENQDRRCRCRCRSGSDDNKKHKHLYVALDDWKKGFSIYKIDVDSFNNDKQEEGMNLDPPVLQLESPVGGIFYGAMSFSALGTKMFTFMNQRCGLIYDTDTAVLAIGPHAPQHLVCGFATFIPVGGMLYALSRHAHERKYSFFVMSWGPTASDESKPTEGWSWNSLPPPPAEFNSHVASYSLHRDGCTIFMTTNHESKMCTYSFDTKRSVWTWHGYWALPFLGQGFFDAELDAWVGLRFDGTVCSCHVVSPTATPTNQEPDWKMTQEKLAEDLTLSDKLVSASLAHMGRNKFCLIQSLARDGEEGHALGDHNGCLLQLTMFRLKHNHNGQLQITSSKITRSFIVSRNRNHFRPAVFWM